MLVGIIRDAEELISWMVVHIVIQKLDDLVSHLRSSLNRQIKPKCYGDHQSRLKLRHYREGEIVAVAAVVAYLVVVTTDSKDRAFGQVGEGAGNRTG